MRLAGQTTDELRSVKSGGAASRSFDQATVADMEIQADSMAGHASISPGSHAAALVSQLADDLHALDSQVTGGADADVTKVAADVSAINVYCAQNQPAPTQAAAQASTSPSASSACPLPLPDIDTLVADQEAQDKALQDDWWEGGQHETDLHQAMQDASSAPQASLAAQFASDAQTFLTDSTPYPSPQTSADYDALAYDIVQLASQCGVTPPGPNPDGNNGRCAGGTR